ncbi:lactonase family protein [Phytomonospora sp. NPDC050363]|uniref:lactonase family protein n=1 Tax=Phytomonospora sp. NPDC050363 TaxID=3155642 RepID=UPI0033F01254
MLVLGGYGEGVGLVEDGAVRVVAADRPSYVVSGSGGRVLYAALERDDVTGGVLALHPDGTVLGEESSGGVAPCHLALHPGGHWLFTANYGSGTVGVLPVYEDGGLGALHEAIAHIGSGPNADRQEGPHVHQIVVDPSGRWVLAVDLGIDKVVVYSFADGELSRHGAFDCVPGTGPRHLAFSPDGHTAYIVGELDDSLTRCGWDARTGTLSAEGRLRVLPENVEVENFPAAVLTSPDGRWVYVTNRGHDSIAVVETSPFELRTTVGCGGNWPRDAALSPDGERLYVANQTSGNVAVFAFADGVPVAEGESLEFPSATSVLPLS